MILHDPAPPAIPPIQVAALEAAIRATREIGNSDDAMPCPICGIEYVHPIGSGALQDDVLTLIGGDGTHITRGIKNICKRGSCIVSVFQCEEGDVFALTWAFHKGLTFAVSIPIESVDNCPVELWRD